MKTTNKALKLFEENQNLVYHVLNRYYPTYVKDEDLKQDALLGLWKACLTFDESKAKFSTYATQCIINSIRHTLRSRNKRPEIVSLDQPVGAEGSPPIAEVIEDPASQIDDGLICFKEFWKTLNRVERCCIKMSLEGYIQDDIAKTVGKSRSWVNKTLKTIQENYEQFRKED